MTGRLFALLGVGLATLAPISLHASDFIYRGHLEDAGAPAEGHYDLRLTLYGDAEAVLPIIEPVELSRVAVAQGRFLAALDFGALPPALDAGWVEVQVRSSEEDGWWTLPQRQSVTLKAQLCPESWTLAGNDSTHPDVNFLGTTDDQPLLIRTRNVQSLRIEPSAELFIDMPITANIIAGSWANHVAEGVRGATIGGGGVPPGHSDPPYTGIPGLAIPNSVGSHYGTVAGGWANVAGGEATNAGAFASVGGGMRNQASGPRSTIGGGGSNVASGSLSVVGGGLGNHAVGVGSAVGGGWSNLAFGTRSTVGGGEGNCAGGAWSWAGGERAKVRPGTDPGVGPCGNLTYPGDDGDSGTFAWADAQHADLVSTGVNQFLVRAAGGIYFGTNSTVSLPADRFINTSTGAYLTSGGTWTNASSRTLKTAFEAVDPRAILDSLLRLPLERWRYVASPGEGVHLGPVSEDFRAAFGLGADDEAISTVDASGVALAAIQGLDAKLETENAQLRDELATLRAEFAELRERIAPAAADGGR